MEIAISLLFDGQWFVVKIRVGGRVSPRPNSEFLFCFVLFLSFCPLSLGSLYTSLLL